MDFINPCLSRNRTGSFRRISGQHGGHDPLPLHCLNRRLCVFFYRIRDNQASGILSIDCQKHLGSIAACLALFQCDAFLHEKGPAAAEKCAGFCGCFHTLSCNFLYRIRTGTSDPLLFCRRHNAGRNGMGGVLFTGSCQGKHLFIRKSICRNDSLEFKVPLCNGPGLIHDHRPDILQRFDGNAALEEDSQFRACTDP